MPFWRILGCHNLVLSLLCKNFKTQKLKNCGVLGFLATSHQVRLESHIMNSKRLACISILHFHLIVGGDLAYGSKISRKHPNFTIPNPDQVGMILVRFLNALRRWVVSRGLAKIPPGPGLSRPYKFCSTSLCRKRARTSCDTLENIESAGGCSLMSNVLFLDAIESPNTYPYQWVSQWVSHW